MQYNNTYFFFISYSIYNNLSFYYLSLIYSQHISDILVEMDLHHEVKQGMHARAEYLLKQPIDPVEPEYFYLLDGTAGAARTGGEVVDTYTTLWQEVELITLDEGVYGQDAAALMTMHKVCIYCVVCIIYVYVYVVYVLFTLKYV